MASLTITATRCGELSCQKDSSLSFLSTKVVSCRPRLESPASKVKDRKKDAPVAASDDRPLFEVVLEDTVLFPEGGGQPSDSGFVGGVPCLRVENQGGLAVHVLAGDAASGLVEGADVKVEVDWARRWDHTTQHTSQHLVTALAVKTWGIETIAWNLGEASSFLELGTPGP
jgi:Ser-tRNA(Ala) deacylase AlaX